MGIYDREYYRGETHGSGWLTGAAPACRMIILTNVIVFLFQQGISEEFRNTAQSHGDHNGTFPVACPRNLSRVPESNRSRTDQDEGSAQQAT